MNVSGSRGPGHFWWWLTRIAEAPVKEACALYFALTALFVERQHKPKRATRSGLGVGVVAQEFFAPALGGLNGFGMTARMLVGAFDSMGEGHRALAVLPRDLGLVKRPEVRRIDGADVLLLPSLPRLLCHAVRFVRLLRELELGILIAIDHLPRYEYVFWAAPRLPLVIYLGDPRGVREWERIGTVHGELLAHRRPHRRALLDLAAQHRASYRRVRRWSRWFGRPLVFATDAPCLVERAREKFGEPGLEAHFLPNPLAPPPPAPPRSSPQPMLLVLGRLAPQKRPWIVPALARRLPHVQFILAGSDEEPDLVEPLMARFGHPPNLRRTGAVLGEDKERLLRDCWALLNSSLHEGLPVTFLEAFGYAKPVVSCVDPDGLVARFGYPVSEVLGDGLEDADLDAFESAIRRCLEDEDGRRRRGLAARDWVEGAHSLDRFRERFGAMLRAEGLSRGGPEWTVAASERDALPAR